MQWFVQGRSPRKLALLVVVIPATFVFFAAFASAAFAGNFFATGHDQDYHCTEGGSDGAPSPSECAYYKITTTFVRGGSSLPLLILDRDSTSTGGPSSSGDASGPYEAVTSLNLAYSNLASQTPTPSSPPYVVEDPQGIQTTMINGTPPPGITSASRWATTPLVDSSGNPLFSAIIVASDTNCGGCDLNNTDGTHLDSDAINARTSDIQSFFNAGGGLLYLAGATDAYDADGVMGRDVYYASVPVPVGGQPVSPPFTVTPDGMSLGITDAMVNCCQTHNSFTLPAAGSVLKVAETDSASLAESLFIQGGAVCSGTFCSADKAITATGTAVSATEGKKFTGTVATFNDPDTSAKASEYSASINWGDGSTSTGTVTGTGGNFTVAGTHTYKEQGTYTVKVTITDVDNTGNSKTTTSTATVADAALHASSARPHKSKLTVSGTLARFTDANPNAKTSDYKVTIKWGDGHSTTTSAKKGTGHFFVKRGHTYSHGGSYRITIKIVDDGGSTATVSRTVTVSAGHVAHHAPPPPKFTG